MQKLLHEGFKLYSWIWNFLNFVMEFMPPVVRMLWFKIILNSFGKKSYIDYHCYFRYPSRIAIGNESEINRGCRFFGSMHTKDKINIRIGDHVSVGPDVTFLSAGHEVDDLNLADNYGKIEVKDYAWIGGGSIILQGVTIGVGAIVGGYSCDKGCG